MVKELVKISEKRRPTGESRAEKGWEIQRRMHEGAAKKSLIIKDKTCFEKIT